VCGLSYLLSSYAALLVFSDGMSSMWPTHAGVPSMLAHDNWFTYVLQNAGFFALVYLALLSLSSERFRSLRSTELALASAACGVASAFLFALSLRFVPDIIDGNLIARIIIAVVLVVLPARFVLESLRRVNSENGTTVTRRTAVLLSSGYMVSCFLALVVAHLPMWPRLHIGPDFWNIEIATYITPLMLTYSLIAPLLVWCFVAALACWFLHILLLASLFPRWRGLPQRWFAFASIFAGALTVVIMGAVRVVLYDVGLPGVNVVLVLIIAMLIFASPALLATFAIFEAIASGKAKEV
jgi:hypothetical protein